ncbi:hypothetical protein AAGG74_14455 [Bacillus mexicanus]|uniref:hypothetical protein n=1 Tax=Bacillus mexicanus TaxID=2834415 RepID=UPI003D1AEAE0
MANNSIYQLFQGANTNEELNTRLDELISVIHKSNVLNERLLYLKEEELRMKKREMACK